MGACRGSSRGFLETGNFERGWYPPEELAKLASERSQANLTCFGLSREPMARERGLGTKPQWVSSGCGAQGRRRDQHHRPPRQGATAGGAQGPFANIALACLRRNARIYAPAPFHPPIRSFTGRETKKINTSPVKLHTYVRFLKAPESSPPAAETFPNALFLLTIRQGHRNGTHCQIWEPGTPPSLSHDKKVKPGGNIGGGQVRQ